MSFKVSSASQHFEVINNAEVDGETNGVISADEFKSAILYVIRLCGITEVFTKEDMQDRLKVLNDHCKFIRNTRVQTGVSMECDRRQVGAGNPLQFV